MKARALFFALIAGVVSMTSGCHCFHTFFPNVGWRFHHGGSGAGPGCAPCAPACAPCGPIAYRPPIIVPGGFDGHAGVPVSHSPAGYPSITYPPIIGSPQPLPGGPGVIPNNQLPAPMPEKKKDGN